MANAYGDMTGTLAARLEKEALKHVKPMAVLQLGAKKFTQPQNSTKTIRYRQAIPYAALGSTDALTEGSPPSATDLRYNTFDVTMSQYGGYTPFTDVMVDFHTTPLLRDINELNAEQIVATKEALLWGMLSAGTSVIYANGVANKVSVVAPLAKTDQATAIRTLQRNKAKKFTSIVTGGVKQGTLPLEAAYIAFAHTDTEAAIRAMDNFVPVSRYGSMSTISEYEFGSVDNVRYITSPDLNSELDAGGTAGTNVSNATATDVYMTVYCGQDAYGCVNLAGKGAFTPMMRQVGKPDSVDVLGQKGHLGFKFYSAEMELNSDWWIAVKHSVTD